jgi:hypothetical protein
MLFWLYEFLYKWTHYREWREHMRYVREFDDWQDGKGPMPDLRDHRP